MPRRVVAITVGELKGLIKDLPDCAKVFPDFRVIPSDDMPSVVFDGFRVSTKTEAKRRDLKKPYLQILVSLVPLEGS